MNRDWDGEWVNALIRSHLVKSLIKCWFYLPIWIFPYEPKATNRSMKARFDNVLNFRTANTAFYRLLSELL